MLKPLKPNSFWSLPFLSVPIPLPFAPLYPPLFSQLNCKYQVPFILFCYFCYYCYYIVVLVIFFSLVDRRSSVRTVYPQSQSVNTFQSLVQEGKNRTKCFIFILSPSISLFMTFPFPHKCRHNCFIYCIVFFWGVGGSFPLGW